MDTKNAANIAALVERSFRIFLLSFLIYGLKNSHDNILDIYSYPKNPG